MATRKLKNAGRKKAPFGSETAAILAAAAIGAASNLASAGINASATKKAATDQAAATMRAATQQANAIKEQNVKSKENMQNMQEFQKEQNAEFRDEQNDIQMQLQMLTGQQNVNERLEASKIQVKNGGSTKRKLRLAGKQQSLLRGSNNMPFVVTDGGGVIPIGQTPEGYDIYEILGNDHEHYHKAQGGKNKTGVGLKFADGSVIEGEGNQNSNQGELIVDTPNSAYFLSKHSIAGFNPAKMTKGGMHPLQAYVIQERLKAANGISDDGKHNSSPVKKALLGADINSVYGINQIPIVGGVNASGDVSVGIVAGTQNKEKRLLRCGGKTRQKAKEGYWTYNQEGKPVFVSSDGSTTVTTPSTTTSNTTTTPVKTGSSFSRFLSNNADLIGAGIGALGNIGGAFISAAANRSAANTLADARMKSVDIMRRGYNSLTGIDLSSIRKEDYAAAHAMPALRAPISYVAGKNALVDRSLQRSLANAGKYSMSGAAAQQRMTTAEVGAQDAKMQNYIEDTKQKEERAQQNAEAITRTAMFNAQQDNEASKQYGAAYLDALKYNNNIDNAKILGAAGALAEGSYDAANTLSQAQTGNAQLWANALMGSTQGFTNSLSNMATRRADLAKVLLGAGSDSQASYFANSNLSSRSDAKKEYNRLATEYESIKDSEDQGDQDYAKQLKRRINSIASSRGFKMIS